MTPLNILHVFRAPVGGLFRHVLDLAREQIARGHRVGLIADSNTGGSRAEDTLGELAPSLAFGVTRFPMRRHIGPGDALAIARVMRRIAQVRADIVHGHGAKGGAYARMAFNARDAVRAYTPHGGSLLLEHSSLSGRAYLTMERVLMPRGNLYLFESAFSGDVFRAKIGNPPGLVRVVPNGVGKADFAPVPPAADATDLVFIGELRVVKGIDTLLHALAALRRDGQPVTLTLVGDGPEAQALRDLTAQLGLQSAVHFMSAMPMRQALARGKVMVIPSRAESMPYVVLEAAAAAKPLITTNVGGIPEIYGELSDALVTPGDVTALAEAIRSALADRAAGAERAQLLRQRVAAGFSVDAMVDGALAGYEQVLESLHQTVREPLASTRPRTLA